MFERWNQTIREAQTKLGEANSEIADLRQENQRIKEEIKELRRQLKKEQCPVSDAKEIKEKISEAQLKELLLPQQFPKVETIKLCNFMFII